MTIEACNDVASFAAIVGFLVGMFGFMLLNVFLSKLKDPS